MGEWNLTQPLQAQLADAFADLYDWFELHHFENADDGRWFEDVVDDPETSALVAAVAASGDRTPTALLAELEAARGDRDELGRAYRIYRCLHAIDQGIEHQHPAHDRGSAGGRSKELLQHYDEHARFNTAASRGYVLPKWTHRLRGTVFAEHFDSLVRARVDRNQICVIGRAGRGRPKRRMGNPKVVVVPFLYSLFDDAYAFAEVDFREVPAKRGAYFTVNHRERRLRRLKERVKQAVTAIRQSEARIAIFPELALNAPLLTALRDELAKTHVRDDLPLDWVVAGAVLPAGPPTKWPIANVACVLSSAGNVVAFPRAKGDEATEDHWQWVQVKHHRYKLTKKEQERYEIEFKDKRDRLEATRLGRQHFVFEDRSGRYAVVICEDLAQEERTLAELRKLLCRMVIVVLMDGPVATDRWSATRGCDLASQTGGFVVVANSLLLPNQKGIRDYRAGKEIPDPYPDGEQPVGLLIEPQAEDEPPPDIKLLYARATPDPTNPLTLRSSVEEIPFAEPFELDD